MLRFGQWETHTARGIRMLGVVVGEGRDGHVGLNTKLHIYCGHDIDLPWHWQNAQAWEKLKYEGTYIH